ncbi:signal recognition particle-docking protein FtsY [Methanocella conradii HZ254]|uniref:Signal recognition particle receptor FtsY n=1 Tax=Methanocella conradii (strain DSM 24694 / JCM 17849 / CGMCC 1.5162 / HZ254) TaxID=1041930 RepID=H8I470_METCZ|nr:signal recognition particle-docking protein FtsY [Methanocella conradii]AFC99209.1 signal recognition particle-docking protein FtsY [Methanocella conradii HZ254]
MFDKLRVKLNEFRKAIDDKLKAAPQPAEKAGILDKAVAITKGEVILTEKDLEGPLWELEMALLESDVALPVAESIIDSVKKGLSGQRKRLLSSTGDLVEDALRDSLLGILSAHTLDFEEYVKAHEKPVTVVFTGVNGTGKTTTIAKLAELLKEKGYGVVIAAGDTFRAGAIEQLEKHADRLGVKLIKHQQGSDPAAVIYDAVAYARSNRKDVVLADTAGRLHTNVNLMEQLKKISRVIKPDLVIFVDEAIAGNDAVERARLFNDAVPISGSILTKADADSKGGAAISIAHITGKPILYLGIGQGYKDLKKFDPEWFVDRLLER